MIQSCLICKGTGEFNFDACSICDGTGLIFDEIKVQPVQPVQPVQEQEITYNDSTLELFELELIECKPLSIQCS
jgi:DnaJ-class molecular chaperone